MSVLIEAVQLVHEDYPDWNQAEVARFLGCSPSTVYKALNPERVVEYHRRENARPEVRERKRAWDRDPRNCHLCVDCGAQTMVTKVPSRPFARCVSCAKKARRWKRDEAVELYNEGLSLREIADLLGITANAVGTIIVYARREGLVGYRYNMSGGRRVEDGAAL